MSDERRGRAVVEGIMEQVKGKLLSDFHRSLQKTEEEAKKIHAPFSEQHRLEIMMGFAQGCIEAGAEVMKLSGVSYLHYLATCACTGAHVRPVLEAGEEQLHQLFHRLMLMFPRGKMPEAMVIDAGGPAELLELLHKVVMPEPQPAPEDLN